MGVLSMESVACQQSPLRWYNFPPGWAFCQYASRVTVAGMALGPTGEDTLRQIERAERASVMRLRAGQSINPARNMAGNR